jgi:hypothetical protein
MTQQRRLFSITMFGVLWVSLVMLLSPVQAPKLWANPPEVIFYLYMMFWFVGAATAAIALPLWFVSEVGALLRWCFNRE